mmetsp:Transcript_16998/g.38248  ORF Transcript_16998/g.38248 Transcript_16998/m.38248 type:complete len:294 (-) Transcript_16998:527-1408(-)
MKVLSTALLLLVGSASAFSPSPSSFGIRPLSPLGAKTVDRASNDGEIVDRSLRGIDSSNASASDPTSGPRPALIRNNADEVWVPQRARPRRNRKSAAVRSMVRENIVTPANFIYPLFIHEDGPENVPIESMPGCQRHTLESMLREVGEAMEQGVGTFVLFPKVPDALKTNLGVEAYNPEGIVPRAVAMIKEKYPEAVVTTDVALDPYSDQGHDGIVENGKILNDATIAQLCKQAVCQARAGADIVAPSDMMVSAPVPGRRPDGEMVSAAFRSSSTLHPRFYVRTDAWEPSATR